MQFKMAHPSCPLCKRQLPRNSPERTLNTRLCEQCQTMVLTAFRGADSIVADSEAVVPQSDAPAHFQPEAEALGHAMVGAPAVFEVNPEDVPAFEYDSQSPIRFGSPDAVRFGFYEDEDLDHGIPTVEADLSALSEDESSRRGEELSEGFVQTIVTAGLDFADADGSHPTGQPSAFTESTVDSFHIVASPVENRSGDLPSIGEEAVTDSLEAPLSAWDYSHSEWPVLVGPSKPKSFGKLRWAIAAVMLLVCASGYYFLYLPSTPPRRTATARVSAGEPRAAALGSADSGALAQAAPTPSNAPSGSASRPAETVAREALVSNDNTVQARFSLQAAAFPTQGGADEFAEKLKRAGVPSYVVPTDVTRRGRWFRVRVGRFNSAEDAQRYTGEAQLRARAAGLAMRLIVCPYDQP